MQLIFTSPPYPIMRDPGYGKIEIQRWIDWMLRHCEAWRELLTPTGSLMLNLGTVWNPGLPTQSDYIERFTIAMQDQLSLHYVQRLEWYSRTKLAQPTEFVAVRRIRAKPATEPILWFSTTPFPKANTRNVLRPYGETMKKILREGHPQRKRPSKNYFRANSFSVDHGGSIPTNVLDVPHAASNDRYNRACRAAGITPHPCRFPIELPRFAIDMCTSEGDVVADLMAGSQTVAQAAEESNRRWITVERSLSYIEAGMSRLPNARPLLAS